VSLTNSEEDPRRRAGTNGNGIVYPLQLQEWDTLALESQMRRVLPLLLYYRRRLLWTVVVALVVGFVLVKHVSPPKYRAQAQIRPSQQTGLLSSLMGGGGGGDSIGGQLSALTGQSTGSMSNGHDAEELMAIMKSYDFTSTLVNKSNLGSKLVHKRTGWKLWLLGGRKPPSMWQLYEIMQSRFNTRSDIKSGIIQCYFIDPNPEQAIVILNLYIDRLRDQLRRQQVENARLAIAALSQEAGKSADPMLKSEIYDLIASEIRDEKTAAVDADFAFTTIEPAVTPEEPYAPWPLFDAVLLSGFAFCAMASYLIITDWRTQIAYRMATTHAAAGPPSPTSDRPPAPVYIPEADPTGESPGLNVK
jgi:hypothetical protein